MTDRWAARLAKENAAAAGALRRAPGIEVCEHDGAVWLRGAARDDELELALRSLPGARRFTVLEEGGLVADGCRVPQDTLPEGRWERLADWLQLELPPTALAGTAAGRCPVRLVPAESFQESDVLLTALETWQHYAIAAPQVRLDRWAFALAADGRAAVRGAPPPPIAGRRYVEREGVAVEAGWQCSPPLDAAVLREALELEEGDLALLHADASWEHLRADDFVRATRSAVRQSARRRADG